MSGDAATELLREALRSEIAEFLCVPTWESDQPDDFDYQQADGILGLPSVRRLLADRQAVQRVEALADRYDATARRRRALAAKFHDAGRWQLADGFRVLARQAQTEADRIRHALREPDAEAEAEDWLNIRFPGSEESS